MATYGFDEKKNLVEVPSVASFKIKPGDTIKLPDGTVFLCEEQKFTQKIPAKGNAITYFGVGAGEGLFSNPKSCKTFVICNEMFMTTPIIFNSTLMYQDSGQCNVAVKAFNINDVDIEADVKITILVIGY